MMCKDEKEFECYTKRVNVWIYNILKASIDKKIYIDNRSRDNIMDMIGIDWLNQEKLKKFYVENSKYDNLILKDSNLSKNIEEVSSMLHLDHVEVKIFEFLMLMYEFEVLKEVLNSINSATTLTNRVKIVSIILELPTKEIKRVFSTNGTFYKSRLLWVGESMHKDFVSSVRLLNRHMPYNIYNFRGFFTHVLSYNIKRAKKSSLVLGDFLHIKSDLELLIPYLKNAIYKEKKGVNILFYGEPGTGKSELTKVLAKHLKVNLFEVPNDYSDGVINTPSEPDGRINSYTIAQNILKKNSLLIYDESEDIFDSYDSIFKKNQQYKSWFNSMLEKNKIPTIWITNSVDRVDNALIRRFDFVIKLSIKDRKIKEHAICKYAKDIVNDNHKEKLILNNNISPAIISHASKITNCIKPKNKSQAFIKIINNTLKAQGHKEVSYKTEGEIPKIYNLSFINSSIDLKKLSNGIVKNGSAKICIYGASGTGKSAYAKYIAKRAKKKFIIKKSSDLLSKWLGGTEQNIADAFKEAEDEEAVLIFDEIDSFLANRFHAQRGWEVTQVNEMLVQMENFDGIFIATTNLMDNLDPASLRRFDLKLEFKYLKTEQAWKMFLYYSKILSLEEPVSIYYKQQISNLHYLTLGDFETVIRQSSFMPIDDIKDFIKRLENEVLAKQHTSHTTVGFRDLKYSQI